MLNVGDHTRVDFKLEVGSAQETVTVEATAVAVQTDTGEVSDVITGQQVTQLATNGRSVFSLEALTPGASSIQADFMVPTSAGSDFNVSFNGQRVSHNMWLVDGGEAADRGGGGGLQARPTCRRTPALSLRSGRKEKILGCLHPKPHLRSPSRVGAPVTDRSQGISKA